MSGRPFLDPLGLGFPGPANPAGSPEAVVIVNGHHANSVAWSLSSISPVETLFFQYNPEETEEERQINWKTTQEDGIDVPTSQYEGGEPRRYNFTLFLSEWGDSWEKHPYNPENLFLPVEASLALLHKFTRSSDTEAAAKQRATVGKDNGLAAQIEAFVSQIGSVLGSSNNRLGNPPPVLVLIGPKFGAQDESQFLIDAFPCTIERLVVKRTHFRPKQPFVCEVQNVEKRGIIQNLKPGDAIRAEVTITLKEFKLSKDNGGSNAAGASASASTRPGGQQGVSSALGPRDGVSGGAGPRGGFGDLRLAERNAGLSGQTTPGVSTVRSKDVDQR